MNNHFEIRSVKLKEYRPTLDYHVTRADEDTDSFVDSTTQKGGRRVHPDFHKRLKAFSIHWAILCGYIDQDTIEADDMFQENEAEDSPYKDERLSEIKISKLSISGEVDDRKVIITGSIKTKLGKAVNINSPLTKISEPDEYAFQDALEIDVDLLVDEVTLYLRGDKHGEAVQLDLFDQSNDEEDDSISEVEYEEDEDDLLGIEITHKISPYKEEPEESYEEKEAM